MVAASGRARGRDAATARVALVAAGTAAAAAPPAAAAITAGPPAPPAAGEAVAEAAATVASPAAGVTSVEHLHATLHAAAPERPSSANPATCSAHMRHIGTLQHGRRMGSRSTCLQRAQVMEGSAVSRASSERMAACSALDRTEPSAATTTGRGTRVLACSAIDARILSASSASESAAAAAPLGFEAAVASVRLFLDLLLDILD